MSGMGDRILKFRHYIFSKYKVTTILVASFAFLILSGSLLLSLPIANKIPGVPYIDHLFTATTSTCVTGLVTVVVGNQYTLFGHIVIMFLIQLGGLGLMTTISVLLLLMHNRLEFKERLLLKDALNMLDFNDLSSYIKLIFKFTFAFEGIGALLLSLVMIPDHGVIAGIGYSIFLSISAFCNAGIDCFPGAFSLMPYQNDPIVVLTIATLIVFGGIGFAVWFDLKAKLGLLIRFKKGLSNIRARLRIVTRIVLRITFGLIVVGTVLILIAEYNNSLAGLSFPSKVMNAFFSSVTLRTAGFFTVDFTILHRFTKIIMIIWMFIGGSPGGTAGGIKTTTFFLLVLMMITQVKKRDYMFAFKRRIKLRNFANAFAIFGFYVFALIIAMLILVCIEPFDSLDILFECVSAIGTVGLTTGITSSLSFIGKVVIILLMFIGRVGPITVAYTFNKDKGTSNIKYPATEISVG